MRLCPRKHRCYERDRALHLNCGAERLHALPKTTPTAAVAAILFGASNRTHIQKIIAQRPTARPSLHDVRRWTAEFRRSSGLYFFVSLPLLPGAQPVGQSKGATAA